MRNQCSLPFPGQTDRKMEALLRKEMVEHQAIISSHHKEMQELRDFLKLSIERFNSLYGFSEKQFKEFSCDMMSTISLLREKININEEVIKQQKETILSLHQQLQDFQSLYVSKGEMQILKKETEAVIKQSVDSHLNSFQYLERKVDALFLSLKEELIVLRDANKHQFMDLDAKVESKFSNCQMDKEGVLKEVRRYEKNIFISEKKIENIYTLIDRINKKG